MKRKIIALCVIVAMLATAVISSTMAYFTDTDSAVNVMTMGSVKITQNEEERDASGVLSEFTWGKQIVPAVYSGTAIPAPATDLAVAGNTVKIWDTEIANEIDKIVTVQNEGKSAAYVRTWFAFEVGTLSEADFTRLIHINKDDTAWTWDSAFTPATINVDGAAVNFLVTAATYNGELGAGVTTVPSLIQVALDKTATNEDVVSFGGTYEILAYTQAIQAAGFSDEAHALAEFGTAHPWDAGVSAPAYVTDAASLAVALELGGTIELTDDVVLESPVAIPEGVTVTLNMNGNQLTGSSVTSSLITNEGTLIINGDEDTLIAASEVDGKPFLWNIGTATINGGVYEGSEWGEDNAKYPSYSIWNYGDLTINDATISGDFGVAGLYKESTTVINGGTYIVNSHMGDFGKEWTHHTFWVGGKANLTINGGTFNYYDTSSSGGIVCDGTTGNIVINGGTFNGGFFNVSDYGYGGPAPVIAGGTFSIKPAAKYLAAGATIVTNTDGTFTVTK